METQAISIERRDLIARFSEDEVLGLSSMLNLVDQYLMLSETERALVARVTSEFNNFLGIEESPEAECYEDELRQAGILNASVEADHCE